MSSASFNPPDDVRVRSHVLPTRAVLCAVRTDGWRDAHRYTATDRIVLMILIVAHHPALLYAFLCLHIRELVSAGVHE